MAVMCVVCGRASEDAEFCDHCNADLARPAARLAPARCPLPGPGLDLSDDQRRVLSRVDHGLLVQENGHAWRVHWIARADAAGWLPGVRRRVGLSLACLPAGRLHEEEAGTWLFVEAAGRRWAPWSLAPAVDPLSELDRLLAATRPLAAALEELHRHGLVWLTFDPAAL
jgi:hypothetical protein